MPIPYQNQIAPSYPRPKATQSSQKIFQSNRTRSISLLVGLILTNANPVREPSILVNLRQKLRRNYSISAPKNGLTLNKGISHVSPLLNNQRRARLARQLPTLNDIAQAFESLQRRHDSPRRLASGGIFLRQTQQRRPHEQARNFSWRAGVRLRHSSDEGLDLERVDSLAYHTVGGFEAPVQLIPQSLTLDEDILLRGLEVFADGAVALESPVAEPRLEFAVAVWAGGLVNERDLGVGWNVLAGSDDHHVPDVAVIGVTVA